jgi:N-hydroxyarylamine O-acetyltransferase
LKLADYLRRIRFEGTPRPDLATLRALHRAHALAVPFENLDVQLRRPVTLDLERIYEKIVVRGRGGWCFEMNGIMSWALREIGFDVTRMNGGVDRERIGEFQIGNHLCLLVRLDEPYLVDVGFGGSLIEPLPLRAGTREDRPYRLQLSEIPDSYWRFSEIAPGGDPFTFDFRARPADEALFATKCQYLQTDPQSPFVQTLVVQRRTEDTHRSLRGRVFTIYHSTHAEKTLLNSADELVATLRERFDLDMPEAATLWPGVCARHEAFMAQQAAGGKR